MKITGPTLFWLLTTSVVSRAQATAQASPTGQFIVVNERITAVGSPVWYRSSLVTTAPDDTLLPTPVRSLRPLPVSRIKTAPDWAVYEPVSPTPFEPGVAFFRTGQPQPDGKTRPDRLRPGPVIRLGYDR